MFCLSFSRPRAAVAAALLIFASAAPSPAAAQDAHGTAEGVARDAADGAPLPLLLVRLLPTGPGAVPRGVVTDAEGRFRFEGVPAGEYRLQVEQIGYERTQSPVLRVRAGQTLVHDIRGSARPVQLEAVTVQGGRCLTADQLAGDADLAALWNEAKKGVETRRAFNRQYRYTRIMRQDIRTLWRIRGTTRSGTVDTVVNEPDSVAVREQRRRARLRADGYMTGSLLTVPLETDLLDDDFLRDHCLEPSFDEVQGAFVLRFRPVRPRRDGAGIRGVITLDAQSYLTRRLDFEYLRGDRPFGSTYVVYEDRDAAGSTLRLPARGGGSIRAEGVGRVAATGASATFTYDYGGFGRADPE